MNWKQLGIEDVRLALSEDEITQLSTLSLDESMLNRVIQDTADNVADMFRAAWKAKGYTVDPRPHYVCGGYVEPILAVTRYHLWTRFPMAANYALGEARQKIYDEAMKLLKDPYLATPEVDWTDPALSGYADLSAQTGSSIRIPWQATPLDIRWW